jgi:peptidoglycan-N-acetylmuramic acid deacetylase
MLRVEGVWRRALLWLAAGAAFTASAAGASAQGATCKGAASEKPVYLTFDTGHMGVAPLVAEVLARHGVRVTFFLANERTLEDGGSLDDRWAPWWKARAAEGHVFGSHTWDHAVWRGDAPGGFKVRPTAGPDTGKLLHLSAQDYCATLQRPAQRLQEMAGVTMAPLFRAPGGKTSPALLEAARACGWHHVGWTDAGFLGDELPSDRWPNRLLLERALRNIGSGDILLAHLGIWSRKEVWAPGVLEPLIVGLKGRGFCFATLREHPRYQAHFQR